MNHKLIELINVSVDNKPKLGEPCNHCGWCCLTEVCDVGKEFGSSVIPCQLLTIGDDGKHYCSLVTKWPEDYSEIIGADAGCCAETQSEVIERFIMERKTMKTETKLVYVTSCEFSSRGIMHVMHDESMREFIEANKEYKLLCEVQVPAVGREYVAEMGASKLDKQMADHYAAIEDLKTKKQQLLAIEHNKENSQ